MLLLIILLGYLASTNLKQIKLSLKPAIVKKGTIRSQVIFPGSIDFTQRVVLQFQQIPTTGAMISWVGVKTGDSVTKNQLIASLDQDSVMKQQQSNLVAFWKQRLTFDQTINNNAGVSPLSALNDTQRRLLQQNQADLDVSVFTVELQDIVRRLSNLRSPIDGIVTRVDTPIAGINIQAPDEARFEIINPTTLYFNANVDESEVNNLKLGDKGVIILSAEPTEFIQATVTDIAFSSHQDANSNTVYTVKMALDNKSNADYRFRYGMTGNVVFYEYAENILYLADDYVHQDDNGSFVLAGKNKKKTYVQTGIADGTITEIVKGVGEGEEISY